MRRLVGLLQPLVGPCVATVLLAACSSGTPRMHTRSDEASTAKRLQTHPTTHRSAYKIGPPYRVGGRWYVPADDPRYDRTGQASWYGDEFHGRRTANGESFDRTALTAAHPTLPLPSYVYVTNLANGRTILVRVNDRGPFVPGRIIDLSRQAARLLGYEPRGTAEVRVRYAGRAPLDRDDRAEQAFLAAQPWADRTDGTTWGRMGLGGAVGN